MIYRVPSHTSGRRKRKKRGRETGKDKGDAWECHSREGEGEEERTSETSDKRHTFFTDRHCLGSAWHKYTHTYIQIFVSRNFNFRNCSDIKCVTMSSPLVSVVQLSHGVSVDGRRRRSLSRTTWLQEYQAVDQSVREILPSQVRGVLLWRNARVIATRGRPWAWLASGPVIKYAIFRRIHGRRATR